MLNKMTRKIGKNILRHKAALLIGLGALSLAGEVLRRMAHRGEDLLSSLEEGKNNPGGFKQAKTETPFRKKKNNKREIYQAPSVPAENLIRH